ncbi:alpha/beta fold hydrolase [Flavobacterium sp. 3HN19-14]|uniref:alpha/beta fold hydrolase n=1 Tax=Flavobacterium sp. 3HN19-14 TaxID=3448133 RepID=UPI003EE26A29
MATNAKKPEKSLKIPRLIVITGKFLAAISDKWVTAFASKLFTTPLKHKIPKREAEMDAKSRQKTIRITSINKDVVVYEFGESPKKILFSHGWSGRGTQLVKIAEAFLKEGYSTVSFDAPAHGKSPGKTTLMPEFIATILQLEKEYGPFEAAVGHSLGGMSLLNAMRLGLKIDKLVTIGSGDIIKDIMDDFIHKLELKPEVSDWMRIHFEKQFGQTMDSYSAYLSAKEIDIPVLVIHDNDDFEVPVKCAHHIKGHLKKGELMITYGLGHRKILGSEKVIAAAVDFIKS